MKKIETATAAAAAAENQMELERERMRLLQLVANIPNEKEMQSNLRRMMHEYNETKDAAQTIIGALANIKCVTFKNLHEQLQLPLN